MVLGISAARPPAVYPASPALHLPPDQHPEVLLPIGLRPCLGSVCAVGRLEEAPQLLGVLQSRTGIVAFGHVDLGVKRGPFPCTSIMCMATPVFKPLSGAGRLSRLQSAAARSCNQPG